jgi:hypothetical protein
VKSLTLLFLVTVVAGLETSAQSQRANGSCPVSQVTRDSAPPDPNGDSGRSGGPAEDWYINSDRTIWAGPVPVGGWPSGGTLYSGGGVVNGQKTYWVRPQGKQLVITGHRIDGQGAALGANVPCCYPTGFQIVALNFPTPGCWQVSAKAGDRELTFVTEVKPPSAAGR